jgi:uncharacterized Zn finger protein (UPF0148 family)
MCLQAYYSTEDDLAKQIKEWAEFKIKEGLIYCPYCGNQSHIEELKCKSCGAPLPAEDHKAW